MLNRSLLVVGAHADDHEMQTGSTMFKYHERGYKIVYVMTTNNMSGSWAERYRKPPWYVIMPQREKEAEEAAETCFGSEVIYLGHPQRHYRNRNGDQIDLRYGAPVPDCIGENTPTILTAFEDSASVERFARIILEQNPECIISQAMISENPEHYCTALLTFKAFQLAQKKGYAGSLIYYNEVVTVKFGDFFTRWDTFIDTTGYYSKKLHAVGIHACQKPHPEKLDFEDFTRGEKCGCQEAEVYHIGIIGKESSGDFISEIKKNRGNY